jgi:hypothetical protein
MKFLLLLRTSLKIGAIPGKIQAFLFLYSIGQAFCMDDLSLYGKKSLPCLVGG